MQKKGIFSNPALGFVLRNILIAIGIVVLGIICVLTWLRSYTNHGIEVNVPNLVGLQVQSAQSVVDSIGLQLLVIDSTYSQKVPLGAIVEQTPPMEAHAKKGRMVYVIVNAQSIRQVPLPDVRDMSYRQAEATLATLGIKVSEHIYEPSEFKDIVLDVRISDLSIEPGQRIEEGSNVVLVIGRGKGTKRVTVPSLIGKSLYEARSLLLGNYLTLGSYTYDTPPTEETENLYIVYEQEPNAGYQITEGSLVHIKLSTNVEKTLIQTNADNDDDFF